MGAAGTVASCAGTLEAFEARARRLLEGTARQRAARARPPPTGLEHRGWQRRPAVAPTRAYWSCSSCSALALHGISSALEQHSEEDSRERTGLAEQDSGAEPRKQCVCQASTKEWCSRSWSTRNRRPLPPEVWQQPSKRTRSTCSTMAAREPCALSPLRPPAGCLREERETPVREAPAGSCGGPRTGPRPHRRRQERIRSDAGRS